MQYEFYDSKRQFIDMKDKNDKLLIARYELLTSYEKIMKEL